MSINNVAVTTGGNTALGDVSFEVLRQGNFEFSIDTDRTGTNCGMEMEDGGITSLVFELRDENGDCVDTDFVIAEGATLPAGNYHNDCMTPYGCIESDQNITVTGIVSGSHTLTITGYKDMLLCYQRAPQFTVPGGDLTYFLGPQILELEVMTAGCEDGVLIDAGPGIDAGLPVDAASGPDAP